MLTVITEAPPKGRLSYVFLSQQMSHDREQRKAASTALAAKRGRINPSDLEGDAVEMYENMSEEQLESILQEGDTTASHQGSADKGNRVKDEAGGGGGKDRGDRS